MARTEARANRNGRLARQNLRIAKRSTTGSLGPVGLHCLRDLTVQFGFSLSLGDVMLLDGSWYVTHAGLLRLASRRRCAGIEVELESSDPSISRWIFRATVFKSTSSKGFVGYGDADPSNISSRVQGAELRVAETRAVNRALRKAYGIGICSFEELGSSSSSRPSSEPNPVKELHNGKGSSNGRPRLRDQLSLLIRQHNLNPTLVKAYAADYCGVETLSGASRDLIESFVSHLATLARDKHEALLCKLNSYSHTHEAQP
jgi:hypothetical protein